MRSFVLALLFVAAPLAVGCGGDNGSNPADMAMPDLFVLSQCGHPGDVGNSLGVGRYCTKVSDCGKNGEQTKNGKEGDGRKEHAGAIRLGAKRMAAGSPETALARHCFDRWLGEAPTVHLHPYQHRAPERRPTPPGPPANATVTSGMDDSARGRGSQIATSVA